MTTENKSLANSAINSLFSAMSKLVLDKDLRDFTVNCGDKEWKVHSTVLAARSPFFKAAITNNMAEKLHMKIDIKDFDTETMEEVICYMYGSHIEKSPTKFLLEAAERFQMDDLKEDVIKLGKKRMNVGNVIKLGHLAEHYNIDSFLGECADFIVKNNVEMKEEDLSSKLTVMVLRIYKEKSKTGIYKKKSKTGIQKLKKSEADNCIKDRSEVSSLVTLLRKLRQDFDLADFTIINGNKCFNLHSIILAMRSPFFKAAITNIMTQKLEMKIEIKDLDVETVWEVLNFMYGVPIGKSPVKSLLKAAERFKMDDLLVDVVKLAKKRMTVDNVIEFGHLAEMYNIERFLDECAKFIVENNVEMKVEDMSPKLSTTVLSILKNANQGLKDENQTLRDENLSLNLVTQMLKVDNQMLKDDKRDLSDTNSDLTQEIQDTNRKLEATKTDFQNYKGRNLWHKIWK